jgi:ABC-type branched-subunit amino acid transport system substrate-binding protein
MRLERRILSLNNLRFLAFLLLNVLVLQLGTSAVAGWTPQTVLSPQEPLTDQERRGRQIYRQGTTQSGEPIVAALGEASLEVPANVMPCASCHGMFGKGKPDGVIRPSNLTWESLTAPTNTNRIHPAYSERTLADAITRGVDPAGNKLRSAMPRFQIPAAELADLTAYLKRVGHDLDPGISDNKIVIGTILPKGLLAAMGQSIKAVLTAYFTELNSRGGIYNRSVELKFIEAGDNPAATRAALERFVKEEQVFALTAAFMAGSEKEITSLMDEQEIPLIGPLTLYPYTGEPLNRQVFYLLSGIGEQARVLVDFAAKQAGPKNPGLAVVHPRGDLNSGVVEAIRDQGKKDGLSEPQVYSYLSGHFDAVETVKQLQRTSPSVVFFLGSAEETLSFMREAEKLSWFPSIYGPAAAAGSGILEAPAGFDRKLFFSFPTSPVDQSAAGMQEYRALTEKYKVLPQNPAAQVSTYAAAKLLAEGLNRVGKDLSREQLVRALEDLSNYQTGLMPAITYGPNRRVGALGSYVVTVDLKEKKFLPVGGWLGLN